MSVGSNLQEMENVVTKGAKPADPMPKLTTGIPDGQSGSWEDLGGPTPENYKSDDDSAKLKTPGATLSQVKNIVNKGAKAADPMPAGVKEETEEEEELVDAEVEAEEDEEVAEVSSEEEVEEEEEEVEEEFDIEEDVNALLAGEELSEEFQEKARTIFEAAINLFEDHYVTIPEDRYDVIESMVDKLDEMEEKLNEQIQRNVALNRRLAESVADVIFADVTEGLALSQKDKLASLAENVEFDSEENYREKLVTLRESYFPSNAGTQRNNSETISEGIEGSHQPVSGLMESYLQTLNRVSKK